MQLASNDRFQVAEGYAIAGLVRDEKKPSAPRDVKIPGTIADHEDTDGRREFTGSNLAAYWFQSGSSGSPVFVDGGEQLAGIVSLSELGANEGKSRLHEAFVVPGTTIRAHVFRLTAAPVARRQHLNIVELQPVLDALGAQDVPLAEIPRRLAEFIVAARARAAEQVPASNEGADIDAAIVAARAKLGSLDAAGAQTVLRAKIAEVEATHRQRLIPLLAEKAAVEQLSYDHTAAKARLNQLLTLDPDRVWSWIELGRLGVTMGSLDEAATAFKAAFAAARRAGDERDESVAGPAPAVLRDIALRRTRGEVRHGVANLAERVLIFTLSSDIRPAPAAPAASKGARSLRLFHFPSSHRH